MTTKFICLREIENIMRKSDLPDTYISSINNIYHGDYYIKQYYIPFDTYTTLENYSEFFNMLYEKLTTNNIEYLTYYSNYNKFSEDDNNSFYFVLSITDKNI
jgi:Iap family predicted aminopeptidase